MNYFIAYLTYPISNHLYVFLPSILVHPGAHPLYEFNSPRGFITCLHALALMGGYRGGQDLEEITELIFDYIRKAKLPGKKRSSGLKSSSRSGTLKLNSVLPDALQRRIKKEMSDDDIKQKEFLAAMKLKDMTGNNPLHLAFVMVMPSCYHRSGG